APAAGAPVTTPSGKRPVTAAERAALQKERNQAASAVQKAERAKTTDPATLQKLRSDLAAKQAALDATEGPPKPPALRGKKEADAFRDATQAHEALVQQRVEAETPPLEARKPKPAPPSLGTTAERAVDAAKHTRGASPYGAIWRDAGLDPAAAVNMPIAKQSAIAKTQMQAAFGFKGVTSKLSHNDTVQALSTMYQNAKGMAHALGMPYEEISLNGRISLHLEPRNEDYLGVYKPGA